LTFDLKSSASADELATLVKLTERYCVVLQTLRSAPPTEVELRTSA
ncbi:MAG: hypothetical protein QOF99_3496, partial [Pseudonocardiales bacterium]|nr:hypothetical protein [Pseudonocardiales bacterium]